MSSLLQVLLSGAATGCVYGLVALSFVLIFKATSALSFMQGELLMAGAFAALAAHQGLGLPLLPAVLLAVLAMAGFAMLGERLFLRRLVAQPALLAVLLTFGLGMMLRGLVASWPGAAQQVYRLPFGGEQLRIGEVLLPTAQLWVIAAALLLALLLAAFFRYTRLGLALRACAENPELATLMGVRVSTMQALAWGLGGGLAALAGVLLAPLSFVHLNMGDIAFKAFPAAVLGGMSSLGGALLGGLALGLIEALAGLWLPEGFKDALPYLLLLFALLLFPRGLGQWRLAGAGPSRGGQ